MSKRKVRLFPWFAYQNRDSVKQLKEHADELDGISIFGKRMPAAELFACCREYGIDTLKLVGGTGEGAFETPAQARATIDGFLRDCTETGYGGIDLDYEHVPPRLLKPYATFMRDLGRELHAVGKRLSICVHGMAVGEHGRPETFAFYDPEAIAAACDEVRPMCYDYYFAPRGITGPTTAWLWAREVMQFWLQYIPLEKMYMALPAYGNDFSTLPNAKTGKQVNFEHPTWVEGAHDIEHAWLHQERLNFYRYLDADGKPRVLYATDEESTRELLKIVDAFRIPAISFWYYQTMTPGIWKALKEFPGIAGVPRLPSRKAY